MDQSKLSLALQRAVMEILVSRSKLTGAAARRMAKRMELGMAEERKSRNLA